MKHIIATFLTFLLAQNLYAEQPDILLADFEQENYANWKTEGEAFGNAPARGTLEHQMQVSGYEGKQLVNSYYRGDAAVGKLTSPEFRIERRYITFLIGGGGFEDETCMKLLLDGKEVRQATGDNVVGGGTEKLDWKCWDVAEFAGKNAVIEIIDNATGGWGHINVDQISMSNSPRGKITIITPKVTKSREIAVEKRFLHLPVKTGNPKKWMTILSNEKIQREWEIELAESNDADFYVTCDVTDWLGKTITLTAEKLPEQSQALDAIVLSDELADQATVYKEKLRPIFHFTAQRGWINDPNGLLFYNGVYHVFGQHNPYGVAWGNMTWLHAVSKDLIHWTELPDAIYPDELGTMFSGSGVVDAANTSGFQNGTEKPLVLIYTAAGGSNRMSNEKPFTQGLAFSQDGGKTWKKYEGNPILKHIEGGNRDPKVFWHEHSKQWIMTLYLDREDYAIFGSPNLKNWTKLCDVRNLGCSECPDMFELAIDGDANNKKWIFWGANGIYFIGAFDGKTFTPETKPLRSKFGQHDYAAQTFSDIPANDGRRIQIAWMIPPAETFANMPFNGQWTIPRELTLRTTSGGTRLFINPIKEIETLRQSELPLTWKENEHQKILPFDSIEAAEIQLVISLNAAKTVKINICGIDLLYDVSAKKLNDAPMDLIDGKLKLRMFLDRSSLEIFANDGIIQIANYLPLNTTRQLILKSEGGEIQIDSIQAWKLKTIWEK